MIERADEVKMMEIARKVFGRSFERCRKIFQVEVAGEIDSPLLPLLVEDSLLALRAYLADIRRPLSNPGRSPSESWKTFYRPWRISLIGFRS